MEGLVGLSFMRIADRSGCVYARYEQYYSYHVYYTHISAADEHIKLRYSL